GGRGGRRGRAGAGGAGRGGVGIAPGGAGGAGAAGGGGGGHRHSDGKVAPAGADIPAADDAGEVRLGVEVGRGLRETAAQHRGEVVVSWHDRSPSRQRGRRAPRAAWSR